MAISYSAVAAPSVAAVRSSLGLDGPSNINQWAWLLDAYGVSWYATQSQDQLDAALRNGHPVIVAAWMGSVSPAPDFQLAWAEKAPWQGRYCDYALGHALVIVGTGDGGSSYLVHDPNVFPGDATDYYADGSPKGAYRRYSAGELWTTVADYGTGLGLAVVPQPRGAQPAQRIKRVDPSLEGRFPGPGGGVPARRGSDHP